MKVVVRLFASMAEGAGAKLVELQLGEGAVLADALGAVRGRFPDMRWPGEAGLMVAVNQEYAEVNRKLYEGDEVAIIPPVSGGSCFMEGVGI